MEALERLCRWYESNCDGDWEHGYGVRIDTLDNPGWTVSINLKDTRLEGLSFLEFKDQYDHAREWLVCSKTDEMFMIACGPRRLKDGLTVFLDWAEASTGSAG
jgi:hypothetical protein